jgi:putative nucleotidyltransferase with HDIG domain
MGLKKKVQKFYKSLSDSDSKLYHYRDALIKTALFIAILFVVQVLFSTDKSYQYSDMKIGNIASKKVVAPFNFYILKTEDELKKERGIATNEAPYFFNFSDSVHKNVRYKLSKLIQYIIKNRPIQKSSDSLGGQAVDSFSFDLEVHFDYKISKSNLILLLDLLNDPEKKQRLQTAMINCINYLNGGIIDVNKDEIRRPKIVIVKQGIEETVSKDVLTSIEDLNLALVNFLSDKLAVTELSVINYLFIELIKPNLVFDKERTDNELDRVIGDVSLTKDLVFENERIVDANQRIDKEIYQKLTSLDVAIVEKSRVEGNWREFLSSVGKLMLLTSIIAVFGMYLFSFRRKIFYDNQKLTMIAVVFLFVILMASIITGPLGWPGYLIPTTIASMLIAILIDAGIAFVGTLVIALILGIVQGGGFDFVLISIVGGMASIFSVHKIHNRNNVFKAIIYISAAYFWIIMALHFVRFEPIQESFTIFLYELAPNAILAPFITFMILGVFEKIFDVTTNMALLELSDLNNPLLKKLSMEAPGTFHHSMVVGNLSEAAAKAIGANPLLARVGSYYHDIGKMDKPEYFIENQMDAENRHNMLKPNMSALILASHVKIGLEMAEKAKIPQLIRNFIPEHHGTSIMSFFYKKAQEMPDAGTVNESDFRYPGPKPHSKETGIVMLADAVEAATRTITNPNPSKVRAMVDSLVAHRFEQGELDECNLTLRDLKQITEAFLPVLSGVFQRRIEYPSESGSKTEKK